MTEGTILIDGSAGDDLGASMRRGLVAVGGSCGEAAGFGMIAGTILVFGSCGRYPGPRSPGDDRTLRRRSAAITSDLPAAGRFRPLFLRLIAAELARLGFPMARGFPEGELTLYHGDLVSLSKGEVWFRDGGQQPERTTSRSPAGPCTTRPTESTARSAISGSQAEGSWNRRRIRTSRPTRVIDAAGLVVMPGGVDMHCHIAGSKVNTARMMCPERTGKGSRSTAPG